MLINVTFCTKTYGSVKSYNLEKNNNIQYNLHYFFIYWTCCLPLFISIAKQQKCSKYWLFCVFSLFRPVN
ncbi:unnamed protein product [Blepharisma stoltei]|uniref:Uncharacterized protein n=1 Tax=Blepharisma stoltei TaxID=1481888 RepID=A0AAU9IFH8_9CILI|nr:unnamed protein product [Blepharisma stoltei]